ncbi:MAG: long-chain-fatty-acid--CoA ligase [Candidatus Poribacteria bacterium]|nr:MAG: long-chain-fatty-acid--CoA ligase [Candidatus Poribacteria bacterium]
MNETLDRGGFAPFGVAQELLPRLAVLDSEGEHSYNELDAVAATVAARLLEGRGDLQEERVALAVLPGFPYAAAQWGVWRAGGIVVPLAPQHPEPEWEHVLRDSGASRIICDAVLRPRLEPLAERMGLSLLDWKEVVSGDLPQEPAPRVALERRAMILYTSGTTGRPKGVVLTHRNVAAQVASLVQAWEWTPEDRILHVLPLHHIHGIVNALCCPLWAGASVQFLPRFDPFAVWEAFASGEITLFMGVPTMYSRLIAAWEGTDPETQQRWREGARRLRLFVSGSAALPVPVFERWEEVTGHRILERYGMTEIGMALSNPLRGERVPGTVGYPLPGVRVRLRNEAGTLSAPGEPGEIEVCGPTVFREYWNRPEETRAAFREGWFCTGDLAVQEGGRYRILGRLSTDIIKVGGYKVSALEIEHVLKAHPAVEECAVLGIPDPVWGERIAAAVVLRAGVAVSPRELRAWCRGRLASYKTPSRWALVKTLPKNAMGKTMKPALRPLFQSEGER